MRISSRLPSPICSSKKLFLGAQSGLRFLGSGQTNRETITTLRRRLPQNKSLNSSIRMTWVTACLQSRQRTESSSTILPCMMKVPSLSHCKMAKWSLRSSSHLWEGHGQTQNKVKDWALKTLPPSSTLLIHLRQSSIRMRIPVRPRRKRCGTWATWTISPWVAKQFTVVKRSVALKV